MRRSRSFASKELSIEFLGELDSETFEQYQALIGDPALIKRARHAVTEMNELYWQNKR